MHKMFVDQRYVQTIRRCQDGLDVRQSLIRAEDDHDHRERGPGLPWGREPQCDQGPRGPLHLPPSPHPPPHRAADWPGPRPDPDTPPGDEYKTTGTQSQLRQSRGPFRNENVCFIQTSSFYIPISTWFPCLGPGHIQSCHSLLNADKLISITGTLLSSLTRMLDFADIFRKQ